MLLVSLSSSYYLLQQPIMGLTFAIHDKRIVIDDDHRANASINLTGRTLSALRVSERIMPLMTNDILPEPDVVTSYAEYNQLFQRQSEIKSLLQSTSSIELMSDGTAVTTPVFQARLRDLPLMFWVQLMVANICFLGGLSIWSFRQGELATRYYGLTGFFLALTIWPAAIYSSRELVIDGNTFYWLSALNHLGAFSVISTITGLFWCFPKRIAQFPLDRIITLLFAAHWLLDLLQWYPNLDISTRVIPLSGIIGCILLLSVHWYRSRGDILYRQSTQWVLLTITIGCGIPGAASMLAPLFDHPNLINQGVGFLAFLLVYISLALGILRYQLFDLDRWWFEVWLWIALAALFTTIDIGFLTIVKFSSTTSMWISLLLCGWLYFPLRQWLINRLLSTHQQTLEKHLPMIVRSIAGARNADELTQQCADCLLNIYAPMSHREIPIEDKPNGQEILIGDGGLTLLAPLPQSTRALELHCPFHGQRLFKAQDREVIHALLQLFANALDAGSQREQAVNAERQRIKEDMHDTIGGHLLSIMRHKSDSLAASIARTAWSELRDILTALETQGATLGQILDLWCNDITQQAKTAQTRLEWQVDDAVRESGIKLDGNQRFNTGQILRELVTNAMRHAHPTLLTIRFRCTHDGLTLSVSNNGVSNNHHDWVAGKGMHHIQKRAQRLSAQLHWESTADTVYCSLTLPLKCTQSVQDGENDQ